MKNKFIYNQTTKLVRIDMGMHKLLKLRATEAGTSIKTLLEEFLQELLEVKNDSLQQH